MNTSINYNILIFNKITTRTYISSSMLQNINRVTTLLSFIRVITLNQTGVKSSGSDNQSNHLLYPAQISFEDDNVSFLLPGQKYPIKELFLLKRGSS